MDIIQNFYKNTVGIKNDQLVKLFATNSIINTYKRNELIFNGDKENEKSYPFLLKGIVRIYSTEHDSLETTSVILYESGTPILLCNPLEEENDYSSFYIQSLTKDTTLVYLNLKQTKIILEEYKEDIMSLLFKYTSYYNSYNCKIARIRGGYKNIDKVKLFLYLFPDIFQNQFYGISQYYYASLIGIPRQTYNKCLNEILKDNEFIDRISNK